MNTPSTPAEQAIRAARQAQDGADAARQVLEQAAQRRPAIVHARIPDGVQAAGHWPLANEEGTWSA